MCAPGDASQSRCAGCLYYFKYVARGLGVIVSLSFAVQACRLFAEPKVEDFWEFCHWIGQASLGIFVGLGGCYAEMKGMMKSVANHFGKFALNRIGLSVFYFWLGCYIMGGTLIGDGAWKILAHSTGIASWCVAASDLLIACCSDKADDDEEEEALSSARHDPPSMKESSQSSAAVGRSQLALAEEGAVTGTSHALSNGNSKENDLSEFQSSGGDTVSTSTGCATSAEPEGGWAGGWADTKPFGAF